jgi:hypothetical protein
MADLVGLVLYALMLALPIAGYVRAVRLGQTRRQVLAGAMVGGGFAGALMALVSAGIGAEVGDAAPYAVIGLVCGAVVGFGGLAARSLGRWLSREP